MNEKQQELWSNNFGQGPEEFSHAIGMIAVKMFISGLCFGSLITLAIVGILT